MALTVSIIAGHSHEPSLYLALFEKSPVRYDPLNQARMY